MARSRAEQQPETWESVIARTRSDGSAGDSWAEQLERRPDVRLVPRWGAGSRTLRILLGLPGFAALWDTEVPARYLDGGRVSCPCGAVTELEVNAVTMCSGGCWRGFLRLVDAVLVHRFEEPDGEDVAA